MRRKQTDYDINVVQYKSFNTSLLGYIKGRYSIVLDKKSATSLGMGHGLSLQALSPNSVKYR